MVAFSAEGQAKVPSRPSTGLLVCLLAAGCGESPAEDPPVDAGPTECGAGQITEPDGSCRSAGIPPEACAPGFEPTDDRSCVAVLPPERCPPSLMAIPGETTCREVAPCGDGPWGDIPVESGSQYVDASFGGVSDGSQAQPWITIQDAVDAAAAGAIVAIAAGSYAEGVVIQDKPLRLWGRCPTMVEVLGTTINTVGVAIQSGNASGTVVRDLAVRGARTGIGVTGATDVLIERVWLHDTTRSGIVLSDDLGPPAATVRGSLIESAHNVGVFMLSAQLVMDSSLVRDTQLYGDFGWGLGVLKTTGADTERSTALVTSSVFEGNRDVGVSVMGCDAVLEGIVIRDTLPGTFVHSGRGLSAQPEPSTAEPATVTLRASVVERNQEIGVVVTGSAATLEAVAVRDTWPTSDGLYGRGIQVQPEPGLGVPATATIRSCDVARNYDVGLLVVDADVVIESTLLRATARQQALDIYGDGLAVFGWYQDASATISSSRLQDNARAGAAVFGGTLAAGETLFTCNIFDIDGEEWAGRPYDFTNLEGNACGCGTETQCKVVSASLEPPQP